MGNPKAFSSSQKAPRLGPTLQLHDHKVGNFIIACLVIVVGTDQTNKIIREIQANRVLG